MELLLILLIVLILWPKPILGALKWAIRHAFGRPTTPEAGDSADHPDNRVSPGGP